MNTSLRSSSLILLVILLATVALLGCGGRRTVEVILAGEGEGEGEPGEGEGESEGEVPVEVVGHDRELRGAWVATVFGINWPSNPNATAAVKRQELIDLVDTVADSGINAIFFQTRPESDAMYLSSLEPWSRFLTGTQGRDPGFDPLQTAIDAAHARGVELHAWVNPYRGLTSTTVTAANNHVSKTLRPDAISYDGGIWMNPASPSVRGHVVDVVEDIVARYDVDGIHFDDYFYPYPGDTAFPDATAYTAYTNSGGTLSKSAWRRENVNTLIDDVSVAIAALRPSARFGVSPFGIYKNGVPTAIAGLDAFEAISCDPVTWLAMDWIDYVAPQLYWPTTQTQHAFGTLLPWWASLTDGDGRFVVAGMNLAAIGVPGRGFNLAEYAAEIEIVRAHRDEGAGGTLLYHVGPLLDDDDVGAAFATHNIQLALPPPVVADLRVPAVAAARIDGGDVVIDAVGPDDRGVAFYIEIGGGFVLESLHLQRAPVRLAHRGRRVAVTTVGKNDRESAPLVLRP